MYIKNIHLHGPPYVAAAGVLEQRRDLLRKSS